MKKLTWLPFTSLTILLCLAAPSQAGYGKGNHVVSGSLGAVLGVNDFDEVKGAGPGVGAAYRYYLSDMFSMGADLALDNYGDHYSEEEETDVDVRLFSTTLTGRIDFWPRNPVATYFTLGGGTHYVEEEFHEPNGNRTETTARAGYFMALGFEAPLNERVMWGAELRSTDPIGVSANAVGLKFSLSYRFGQDRTDKGPEPL